ncbi:hypothetical protein [Deinococcus actinosclerus]|nr:hypothetical protein [Deinococcus actinosclerus]
MYTGLMIIAVLTGLLAVGLYLRARTITPGEPQPQATTKQPSDNSGE